jgi:PRTRC genetic system protein C
MAITITTFKRIFKININNTTIDLEDPNEKLTAQEVKTLYEVQYPQLINAEITNKGIVNDTLVFEFNTIAGTKG